MGEPQPASEKQSSAQDINLGSNKCVGLAGMENGRMGMTVVRDRYGSAQFLGLQRGVDGRDSGTEPLGLCAVRIFFQRALGFQQQQIFFIDR